MRPISQDALMLLAAAHLRIPARRQRALLRGDDEPLREWLADNPSRPVAHARHLARESVHALERHGAWIVTAVEGDYPQGLLDLADPPPFLCVRGTLRDGGTAIVGSRTPPREAEDFASHLARVCAPPVVSGLAHGIDAAAHRGALDAGVPTIAYVGTGIGETYPAEHRGLEGDIVAAGGAIVSERLPGEPVSKAALVRRDRLQASHARAIVLVASETDGGAMFTMRAARELGRARFVLAREGSPAYGGNVQARADGAVPLPFDVDAASRRLRRVLTAL